MHSNEFYFTLVMSHDACSSELINIVNNWGRLSSFWVLNVEAGSDRIEHTILGYNPHGSIDKS